jgi:hypothetical protein
MYMRNTEVSIHGLNMSKHAETQWTCCTSGRLPQLSGKPSLEPRDPKRPGDHRSFAVVRAIGKTNENGKRNHRE